MVGMQGVGYEVKHGVRGGRWYLDHLGCAVREGLRGFVVRRTEIQVVCRKGCGGVDEEMWIMRYAGKK